MERIDLLKTRLDALRPLRAEQIDALYPLFEAQKPIFVQATNAIEGNRLSVGETQAVFEAVVTIGNGITIREHLEAVNGARA